MVQRLARTLCRFLAALVCLLCASELLSSSQLTPAFQSESELRAASTPGDNESTSEAPASREEREEREQDDEDDDLGDSQEPPWISFSVRPRPRATARFQPVLSRDAPRPSHLSLDPRPPRRA